MVRKRVRFSGIVQGVGFRMTCRHAASDRGLSGWVRNEADGTVLMEVQGEAEAVEAMLAAIREMRAGCIEREDHTDLPPDPDETVFEIRR